MKWKTSEMARQEDGAFRLQVDVYPDVGEEIITRTYVFASPSMAQADVAEACRLAAIEAYRLDSERRNAEIAWVGLSGEEAI